METSGQLYASAVLFAVLPEQEAGWAPEPVCTWWRREKSLTLLKRTNPVVQPAVSHCSDARTQFISRILTAKGQFIIQFARCRSV